MKNEPNYWLVGATWGGADQQDAFYLRGYWEMGYSDAEKPGFAKKRDQIVKGDRIAIKSMDGRGKPTISIHALGIVKDVALGKVYIDWKLTKLNRQVNSRGIFATIHGPYDFDSNWTKEVFCL